VIAATLRNALDFCRLELCRDVDGGKRHLLSGRVVRAGTYLELLVRPGGPKDDPRTLFGRYEWSFAPGEMPRFVVGLPTQAWAAADGSYDRDVGEIALPATALLRWPVGR
jgi:hypothetical protein